MANSYLLRITVTGQGVHGSTPWEGKDPMPVAAEIISALAQVYRQEPATDAFTITIGKVEDQGRFNVIGDAVTLLGTVRVIPDRIVDDIKMRVTRIATNVAEAHGQTAKVEWASARTGGAQPAGVARARITHRRTCRRKR